MAALLSLVVERLLYPWSSRQEFPTPKEVRDCLKLVPELCKYFSFSNKARDWQLRFRSKYRRLAPSYFDGGAWVLIFDLGKGFAYFPVKPGELGRVLGFCAGLNGELDRQALARRHRDSRALLARFLRFLEKNGLLAETSGKPRKETVSALRHLSHSCLWATAGSSQAAFDPVFFVPRARGRARPDFAPLEAAVARFSSLSAVFFTHNHWDHFNVSTFARLPRDLAIYVPRVRRETEYNPSLKRFLVALGFTRVQEVDWWQRVPVGDISVLIVPYYGEWFGPGSRFDGFTYLIEARGKAVYGGVDAFRDDRGEMTATLRRLRKTTPRLDCYFYSANGGRHESALVCGMPYRYASANRRYAGKLQYLPDRKTAAKYMRLLRPRRAIEYADFEFQAKTRAVIAF